MAESLVCKNLGKTYKTGSNALRNINLNIPTKGIFALIGRNGAGKTTLVRILATELLQTKGSATINGFDVVKDADKIRQLIAIVPQEGRIIPWTTPRQMVISYLLYRGFSYKEAKQRADESLKKLDIVKYANTQSSHLSGGIKRKALVAAVISSEAKIIFLDEPTTGLDPISRADLWDVLKEMKKDRFIFLTTHYLEEAERLADKIGVIEDGKLFALGTLQELRKKIKYEYSVEVFGKGAKIKPKTGEVVTGLDEHKQIFTTAKEANRLSKELIKKGIRFSSNPVSLEEIFYYIVKRSIDTDRKNGEEKEKGDDYGA
ncbi:MAG: ABC transporter ATP-binding protein [Candidatus Marsarchaeota archaeon]|nr:ABC transporter ATP-binding protein [Candidatus Marsarchaeota archaeon]